MSACIFICFEQSGGRSVFMNSVWLAHILQVGTNQDTLQTAFSFDVSLFLNILMIEGKQKVETKEGGYVTYIFKKQI